MGYIYDFDLASILFFGLTLVFYFYQKRLRNLQDRIFSLMLVCAMLALVFDCTSAMMEYHAAAIPVWLLYAVNTVFIFGMQSCLPLFFLYSLASAGRWRWLNTTKRVLSGIPYLVTMLLLFISSFTDFGIFRIDGMHGYQAGTTHAMLYVNMGIYVVAGMAVLIKNGRNMRSTERNVILLFAGLLFVAMALQLLFPRYLLTGTATALACTSLFYTLQSPIDQINPLTGAFSRTMLPALLHDLEERGRPYTLLLLSLCSCEEFERLYGDELGDELLQTCSRHLIRDFHDDIVVYMDAREFIVVCERVLDRRETEALCARVPKAVEVVGVGDVSIDVLVGVVPGAADALALADYLLREMRLVEGDTVLYADEAYKRSCMMKLHFTASLESQLAEGRYVLRTSQISSPDGVAAMEEAWLEPAGDMAAYVTPQQFLQTVGQNGLALEYYRALLTAFSGRCGSCCAGGRLCLRLPPAAFLRDDTSAKMLKLVHSIGFGPEQIVLAVDEAELASSNLILIENIEKMAHSGFIFMVDAFAEGYTVLPRMASLPFDYARLYEGFARDAVHNAGDAKLLQGLIGILADVGIVAICPGAQDEQCKQAAISAGAKLLQA